jgi:hypothetical protein
MNSRYKILTPSGFQSFDGIIKNKRDTLKISFVDDSNIIVTENHRFIDNGKEIIAGTLKICDVINNKIIINIEPHDFIDVYDPVNVDNGNLYYSNDLISHNCAWLGSSSTLIPGDNLAKLSPNKPIIINLDGLDIFEKPDKSRNYCLTVDVAKGVGGDYSIIQVIDITDIPYKQVAKYRNNKIAPLLFPSIIYKIAKDYNDAHILIEINISEQVSHILHYELEYENLLLVNKSQKGLNRGQVVGGGFGAKAQLGVNTDKKVKRIGCSNLKSLIVENKLLIRDSDTIAELSTFIEVRDSYAADDGYHDDLVMGLVIFAWLTTQQYFKEMNNVNLRKVMYDNQMKMIEEELTPFGFYDDGQTEPDGPIMLLNF